MENELNGSHSDDISKKASDKIDKIKEHQKELDAIQSVCKHSEYTLENIGPKNGSLFDLVRICKICHKEIGKANPEELKKWLEKQK